MDDARSVIRDVTQPVQPAQPSKAAYAQPPPDYTQKCIRIRCGAPLKAGKRMRHFCGECWAMLPAHLQVALNAEIAWMEARGINIADQATQMLFATASQRIWELVLAKDPDLKVAWEAEIRDRQAAEASIRAALAEAARAEAEAKNKIVVVGG